MKKLALLFVGCFTCCQLQAAGLEWLTNLDTAKAKAKTDNKLVLLDFTGSDWCGWCIKLNEDVFSKAEFIEYAKKNLVLVELDFPHKKSQSAGLKAANDKLKAQHQVSGFPTLVVLTPDGKEVWKQVGYMPGGPKAFISKIEAGRKKT